MAKTPNQVDLHVGSRVRARRKELGMSQARLADDLDLTFQQLQKYEKGVNRIAASRLQHVATILKVPVEFFFDGAAGQARAKIKTRAPDFIDEFLADAHSRALARAFVRIRDAKVRRNVVNLVKSIVERRK